MSQKKSVYRIDELIQALTVSGIEVALDLPGHDGAGIATEDVSAAGDTAAFDSKNEERNDKSYEHARFHVRSIVN